MHQHAPDGAKSNDVRPPKYPRLAAREGDHLDVPPIMMFDWQKLYVPRPAQADARGGRSYTHEARFSIKPSAGNPNNPDPKGLAVTFGEQTWDEMHVATSTSRSPTRNLGLGSPSSKRLDKRSARSHVSSQHPPARGRDSRSPWSAYIHGTGRERPLGHDRARTRRGPTPPLIVLGPRPPTSTILDRRRQPSAQDPGKPRNRRASSTTALIKLPLRTLLKDWIRESQRLQVISSIKPRTPALPRQYRVAAPAGMAVGSVTRLVPPGDLIKFKALLRR